MKVLGLDLSSSTGFALIEDGELKEYGLVKSEDIGLTGSLPEYHFLQKARAIANRLFVVVSKFRPDLIVIEQTNLGSARGTQKGLEFVHFAVLDMIECIGLISRISYVDTSAWRSTLGLRLSKEQRKHNTVLSKKRSTAKAKGVRLTSKKGQGKITWKHLSVEWANLKFNLNLKIGDNDISDAIALAVYGFKKDEDIKTAISEVPEFDINLFNN